MAQSTQEEDTEMRTRYSGSGVLSTVLEPEQEQEERDYIVTIERSRAKIETLEAERAETAL